MSEDKENADAAPGPTDEPAEETQGMPDPPADVPADPEHADELKPNSIVDEKSD